MLVLICVQAQTDSAFKLKQIYEAAVNDFAVDNLGNLYIITPTDQLKKLNAKGDSVAYSMRCVVLERFIQWMLPIQ